MSDHSELKKLAEACGDLNWRAIQENWTELAIRDDHGYIATMRTKSGKHAGPCPDRESKAKFLCAVTPVAVLALIAEVEGLRAQHGRDSAELRSLCQARDDARKERDQLKAEVARSTEREIMQLAEIEALRRDAERYRWLREKVGVDLIFGDYSPWLLSCNTDMTDLEKKTTDEAIDAAMTKGSKP